MVLLSVFDFSILCHYSLYVYLQLNVVSMASIGFFIQCRMEDLQEIKGFLGIDGKILLKQGDAIECLRQLPTDSVDLIITDPPYNLGLFMKSVVQI